MGMTGDGSPLLAPVWEGGTIWRETFAMIGRKRQCSAPFLYSPEKIIRIESYDGKNVYETRTGLFCKGWKAVPYPGQPDPADGLGDFLYITGDAFL